MTESEKIPADPRTPVDGAKTTHRHQDGSIWAGPACGGMHERGEEPLSRSAAYIVGELYREIGWDRARPGRCQPL